MPKLKIDIYCHTLWSSEFKQVYLPSLCFVLNTMDPDDWFFIIGVTLLCWDLGFVIGKRKNKCEEDHQ